jgi:hypothetical protein
MSYSLLGLQQSQEGNRRNRVLDMHPVLAQAVHPFAEEVSAVSLADAQAPHDLHFHRWGGQEVVEHLILGFQASRQELERRLKSGESPTRSASLLQWIIKTQTCLFGSMSTGVPSPRSLRPAHFVPQDGQALATRLVAEAEELSKVLAQSRIAFGLRPCGYHPMYGPLRVEEWRAYHAVHCRHHLRQFRDAIELSRRRAAGGELPGYGVRRSAAGEPPRELSWAEEVVRDQRPDKRR